MSFKRSSILTSPTINNNDNADDNERQQQRGENTCGLRPIRHPAQTAWPFGGQWMLLFDWDDENSTHIATHGVSCAETEQVINNEPFDVELQTVNDEERFVQL